MDEVFEEYNKGRKFCSFVCRMKVRIFVFLFWYVEWRFYFRWINNLKKDNKVILCKFYLFYNTTSQYVCITFVWNVSFETCYMMIVSKVIFSIQKLSFDKIYLI